MNLVILTGVSGAGKSTALRALEDIGYYCIDNLPFKLLPTFLELTKSSQEEITKVAVLIDIRSGNLSLADFQKIKQDMSDRWTVEIILLEASDEVIRRRFQETRRRHTFSKLSIDEAIEKEKKMFQPLYQCADFTIDTSRFNVHQLRDYIYKTFRKLEPTHEMEMMLMSFGYSYGVPTQADFVMDVRFLPNPYFIDTLKDLTGETPQVQEFIMAQQETKTFLKKFEDFLTYLLPLYRSEGKSYFTLAIGCTGGKHIDMCFFPD